MKAESPPPKGQKADPVLQKKMQEAMVITKAEADDPHSSKECRSCHDGENSPAFDFKKYWPLIEHHD